jgi:DNA-binding PadR family transcriptional regulator
LSSTAIRLTPTSYIVLGLLEQAREATPYELKRMVSMSVGNFWSLQHAQLYSEPERLAAAGLVSTQREQGGRRRKRYKLTEEGHAALHAWLSQSTGELAELRDPGLLRLFFGAHPQALAAAQLQAHRFKLAEYEQLQSQDSGEGPRGPLLALRAGIGHEREWVRFWSQLLNEDSEPRNRP